eukprot:scaffold103466_cov54-Phaeocystis_antarctica.AAC.3
MTDKYGDGWNGAEWSAPGLGQSFSLRDGSQGTRSFVVQFQPTAPPSPPSPPLSPPSPPSPPGTFTSTASLKVAVQVFNANAIFTIATYGPDADWDVSITNGSPQASQPCTACSACAPHACALWPTPFSRTPSCALLAPPPPPCPPAALPAPRFASHALLSTRHRTRRRSTSR